MKLVIAIIKPFKLEEVRDALMRAGVEGVVAIEAKSYSQAGGHKEVYRGTEYTVDFQPRMRIEVTIADEQEQAVVEAVTQAAQTGTPGDGRIIVLPIHTLRPIGSGGTAAPMKS